MHDRGCIVNDHPIDPTESDDSPEERLEFVLGPREGEPLSSGGEEERRRQEAIKQEVLRQARKLGLDVREVGEHPPQSECASARANQIKREADPAMAEAAVEVAARGRARVETDAHGRRQIDISGEMNARLGIRLSLEGLLKLVHGIWGGPKKIIAIAIKVGKYFQAKVSASTSDDDDEVETKV